MTEFSRRVDVQVIKDEPLTAEEWHAKYDEGFGEIPDDPDTEYLNYLDRFQPFRWRAVAANNEPIAHGESYFHVDGCINAVELLCGDDTTIYWMPTYGEDRGEILLRYGHTDRENQAATS